MYALLPEREPVSFSAEQPSELDFAGQPGIAALYAICAAAIEVLGPVFWTGLIAPFMQAEFFR